jgi:hypothetical protein
VGGLSGEPRKSQHILVAGLVAVRNGEPYIEMDVDGRRVQLTMTEARQIANDIYLMCSRTEADAMIVRFFSDNSLPPGAAAELLIRFRDFRAKIDQEKADRTVDG